MITIISPHIDDAFLSLGGTILKWRNNDIPIKVVYIFSYSRWTNPNNIQNIDYEQNFDFVTELRKKEELEVSKIANHSYSFLDFENDKNIIPSEQEELKKEIINKLISQIAFGSTIFIPLGISHAEHLLIREVGMELFKTQKYDIKLYEDLPYMAQRTSYKEVIDQINQFNFHSVVNEIDINKKIEILKLYGSQLSFHMLNIISMYSYSCKDCKHYERYWEFNKRNL